MPAAATAAITIGARVRNSREPVIVAAASSVAGCGAPASRAVAATAYATRTSVSTTSRTGTGRHQRRAVVAESATAMCRRYDASRGRDLVPEDDPCRCRDERDLVPQPSGSGSRARCPPAPCCLASRHHLDEGATMSDQPALIGRRATGLCLVLAPLCEVVEALLSPLRGTSTA